MAQNEHDADRINVYISVFNTVADAVDDDLRRTGHKRVVYMSKIVEWFMQQSEEVRDSILSGNTSRADAALAKALQTRVVDGEALSFDDAANAVKKLLATMQAQHAAHVGELKEAQGSQKKRKG